MILTIDYYLGEIIRSQISCLADSKDNHWEMRDWPRKCRLLRASLLGHLNKNLSVNILVHLILRKRVRLLT